MPRSETLGVRLDPKVKEALKKAAEADKRKMASLAEKLIVEYLEETGYLPSQDHGGA